MLPVDSMSVLADTFLLPGADGSFGIGGADTQQRVRCQIADFAVFPVRTVAVIQMIDEFGHGFLAAPADQRRDSSPANMVVRVVQGLQQRLDARWMVDTAE